MQQRFPFFQLPVPTCPLHCIFETSQNGTSISITIQRVQMIVGKTFLPPRKRMENHQYLIGNHHLHMGCFSIVMLVFRGSNIYFGFGTGNPSPSR